MINTIRAPSDGHFCPPSFGPHPHLVLAPKPKFFLVLDRSSSRSNSKTDVLVLGGPRGELGRGFDSRPSEP